VTAHPRLRLVLLCLLLALPLALGACGGNGERSIKGQVVAIDATAGTFAVQATDGQRYEFRAKAGSKVDLVHIKEHMDEKKEIEVKFTGTTPPYEASYAH
jgi:hypothetical protein